MVQSKSLFRRSLIVGAGGLLAACTSGGSFQSEAIHDITLVRSGIDQAAASLEASGILDYETQVSVNRYVAIVDAASDGITSAADAKTRLQAIGAAINGLMVILADLPLPPNVHYILSAVKTLLPIAEAMVGAAVTLAARKHPALVGMPVSDARAVLAGAGR